MSDYWLRRAIEDEKRAHRNAQATNAELKALYQRQYRRIYAQMERLYGQVDWGDGEMIRRTQLWEYRGWRALEKELRQFATETPKISVDKITNCLDKVFKETIGVDIDSFGGKTGTAFGVLNESIAVVNTAWSGEMFSSRIWKNTSVIATRIRSDMEDMMVNGRSLGDIKLKLMKDFSVAYNDAARLVDTEAAHVMNSANLQNYRAHGYKKVRWSIAPEDGKECEICKERANKVWHIDTAPIIPAHPRCRCIYVAVIELPGENIPCDGEGESMDELRRVELPKELKESKTAIVLQSDDQERTMAGGGRRGINHVLSEEEKMQVREAVKEIQAEPTVFDFSTTNATGYSDRLDVIFVSGNVMPDLTSDHPRDTMSIRAVLAHEYYGHRAFRNTKAKEASWNDEFRASYTAALNAPGLTDEDRRDLMLDALERAKEAGVAIVLNAAMRRILYGYTDY